MTDYTVQLSAFQQQCQRLAHLLEVVPGNPVTVPTLAVDSQTTPVNRDMVLSYEAPPFPVSNIIQIWYDPGAHLFYKSTNWKSNITSWELQTTYIGLYDESQSGTTNVITTNVNGVVTVPLFLSRNPQADNEAVTKIYLDTVISSITTGTGNMLYGDPVATTLELAQVDVTLVPDKQIRYVESVNRIYGYDLQSNAPADSDYIIAPLQNIGRWISTDRKIVDGGVLL